MRIRDWSSDVCSSDLLHDGNLAGQLEGDERGARPANAGEERVHGHVMGDAVGGCDFGDPEGPCEIAAGVGDAEEDGAEDEPRERITREKREEDRKSVV